MLQWMGGSRKKVNTSRKSTQKRQKQYFEQRKRQQQTAGLENYADGTIKCSQWHEKPRSLDVLSLLNLATVAEEHSSDSNARGNPEINASSVIHSISKCPSSSLTEKVICGDSVNLKEALTVSSGHQIETVSQEKGFSNSPDNLPPSCNYSSKGNGDKRSHWKTDSEHQLSVLDLVGGGEPNSDSEESVVHEAHVAFSVQGLGKVGIETPFHSPSQPGRIFSSSCSSPSNAVRQFHSYEDLIYVMDDLEHELDAKLHDINLPLARSVFESPFISSSTMDWSGNPNSTKCTANDCMKFDICDTQTDNFLDEEQYFYNNMDKKNWKTWNARSSFLNDNFLDGGSYDVAWNSRSYQGGDSPRFLRAEKHEASESAFQGSYLPNKRDADKVPRRYNILESTAPYCKHPTPKKYGFITSDGKRYPSVGGSWGFHSVLDQPSWSYLSKEDATDGMSLLSEESCSSSAVKGEKPINSVSNVMKLKQSMRRNENEVHISSENNCGMKNIYKETKCKDMDETHGRKTLNGSGKYRKVHDQLKSNSIHYTGEPYTLQKSLELQHCHLFKEEGSIDIGSGLGSFSKTSAEDEDLCAKLSIPKLYPNIQSPSKRSKCNFPVEFGPSVSFISGKTAFLQPPSPARYHDFPTCLNTASGSSKPDICLEMEDKPPCSSCVADSEGELVFSDLSRQEHLDKDENKPEFQKNDYLKFMKKQQTEISAADGDLPSRSGRTKDATDSKDNCSECKGSKAEAPELNERPKTKSHIEHVEDISSTVMEMSGKLENGVNDDKYGFDAQIHHPSQRKEDSGSKRRNINSNGLNNNIDPSYEVMIQTYVLQLLCVQKVLKEASQDTMKKV
ncbi:PREDICTED: uncharacterized protein LOC104594476 isoform X2 [Nelumbo nucifera]|uniref:Uncharacterized protein LOC104594476 isoform X2 n=1 Tax=Nelumbo nucifera TaxID=4432 RepID=A0A1U8Q2D3_NELNU|nr:PREDICTED: uncharacterized protein LOC104594476 isoform X2 [Nelumbo nucifera]